jgi:hypothetical protein
MADALVEKFAPLALSQMVDSYVRDPDVKAYYESLGLELKDGLFGYNEPLDELQECLKETHPLGILPEGARLIWQDYDNGSWGCICWYIIKNKENFYHLYEIEDRRSGIMGATDHSTLSVEAKPTLRELLEQFQDNPASSFWQAVYNAQADAFGHRIGAIR